nr:MAG TPA: hypothetical protein [Caudoviricetes sp.]
MLSLNLRCPSAKIQNFELFRVDFKIALKLCLVESFTKFGFKHDI